jgi:predicted Zn-dependent protease
MIRLLVAAVGIALFITLVQSTLAAFRQARGEDEDDPPPDDLPERRDAEGIADWMHARVMDAFALEREGWALERAARVEARLQAGSADEERLRVAILWIPEVTAFTFGRHVYLSRRLLERVGSDEPVAFVVAHEMAHHALGHLQSRNRWMDLFARVPAGALAAGVVVEASRLGYNVEQELNADAWALRRCWQAGYDPGACLRVLDVLEADALDRGDFAAVYGPVPADVDAGPDLGEAVRHWLGKRERGYPPLLERRARLMQIAEELGPAVGAQP